MSLLKENPMITIKEIEKHLDPAFYYREHRRIADMLCATREEVRMVYNDVAFEAEEAPFAAELNVDGNVRVVLSALNEYFFALGRNRRAELPPKENVMVLYGEANLHKSGIHRHFSKYVPTLVLQMNKEFMFNGVRLSCPPRVIVCEQFRGDSDRFPYECLEAFLDCDSNQVFNHKGSSLHLPARPLFIICTNTPPNEWYCKKISRQDWRGELVESFDCELGPATRNAMYSRLRWSVRIGSPVLGFPNPDIGENTIHLPHSQINTFE